MHLHRFRPRLPDALGTLDRTRLLHDLGAGVTVGIVALPRAKAFAIASGVKPEQGICTAMAGVLLLLMGLFRLGALVRYVPVAIVIGSTNGIAVLIRRSGFEPRPGPDQIVPSVDHAFDAPVEPG